MTTPTPPPPRPDAPKAPCAQCQGSLTLAGLMTFGATYATVKAVGAVWRRLR
jgi:hypothetical protein